MKTKAFFLALTGLVVGSIFYSCNRPSQQKVEAAEQKVNTKEQELEKAKLQASIAKLEYDQYLVQTQLKIEENEKNIADLKLQMTKASAKVKAEAKDRLIKLEEKNKDLEKRTKEFKENGKETWADFKISLERELIDLDLSIRNFFNDKKK